MPLLIYRVNDFIEAHEISDKWQVLAIACLIRVSKCAGHDIPEFVDVAHVNNPHSWIKRKSPAYGSVNLLLRSRSAQKALVVEGSDDECMIRKPCFFHYLIGSGLAGKVRNAKFPAPDRFHIRQR